MTASRDSSVTYVEDSKTVEGSIEIVHPTPLVAGELVTVVFSYRVGSAGMREGGRLRVALPNPGWGEPMVPQPYFWDCFQKGKARRYTDYDRVNTTALAVSKTRAAVPFLAKWAGFREPFGFPRRWLKNYDRWWIDAVLEDDGLDENDQLIITYGDTRRLPLSARIQKFADRRLAFLAYVDIDGSGSFREVPGSARMVSVQTGAATRFDVVAPSIIRPAEKPAILVAYTDRFKNEPSRPLDVKSLSLTCEAGRQEIALDLPATSYRFEAPEPVVLTARDRQVYITVEDSERQWTATSNPSLVRNSGPRLFWGDLHAQSQYHCWSEVDQMGISCGTPEDLYHYAHDVAGLDFCAITDTGSICSNIWTRVSNAALAAHRDGRFVVFQGSEVGDNVDGHRNLLFATERPEPSLEPLYTTSGFAGLAAHRAQTLYHGRDDVMLVYHHTKMWNNWSRWDPGTESLLEIYSSWGSGEKGGVDRWNLAEMTGGAQEAWARGYRLGVIAGSDTHVGTPGRNIADCERDEMLVFSNGIAGVWAESLTRAAVFRALKQRHCFGTTGARIILEFFLEDHCMGSEVLWPADKPREFQVRVFGTNFLESLQIVKNNLDVKSFELDGDSAHLDWKDSSRARSGDYYYVRVTQRDGHRAWSSPIWIDLEAK